MTADTPNDLQSGWKNRLGVPIPSYPWPVVPSPFENRRFDEEVDWYNTDYDFLSEGSKEKYKRHGLAEVTAYIFPTDNLDALLVAARNLIFHTVFDDYFELCPVDEMAGIRDHLVAILLGKEPAPDDIGLFRQAALVRDECQRMGMPYFWFQRLANGYHRYITYGLMEEVPYKLSKRFPPLVHGMSIHDNTIGMRPHFTMSELVNDCLLPDHVHAHPMIQRLTDVHQRLFVIQNDLFSLDREIGRETEVINCVLALHHIRGLPVEEACADAIRMSDAYAAEATELHSALLSVPSLQAHRDQVDRYARSM